jgi:hypothetical protein
MTTFINASTSAGLVQTADTSGNLSLQSNGTTILALTSAGAAVTGTLTGGATMLSPITNSLIADVALNNTALYFDGPSVAQGTVGTWFVSGSVLLQDNAGVATINVKLWDGTTTIASAKGRILAINGEVMISLSGYITAPAGNLRISARDGTSTSGLIEYNGSGLGKDSTITAIRIG